MTGTQRPRALHLAKLRSLLVGRVLSQGLLKQRGFAPSDKGKWGKVNELLAGLRNSSSASPDLSDGELKTAVRGLDGRFRDSVKICMVGQSPMVKLDHIYLVVARDQVDAARFDKRVVRNEQVVSLRPTGRVRSALEFDELLLRDHPEAKETHFLEIRTAGQRGSSTRAFYLKAGALDRYIAETVVVHERKAVERSLRTLIATNTALRRAGISLVAKNRVGRLVALRASARTLYSTLRQGPVNAGGVALEDLLLCDQDEEPLQALWRTIYVAVGPAPGARNSAAGRVVREVIALAPTEVVSGAVRRDYRQLRRHGPHPAAGYFLKLKPHGPRGSHRHAYYIDRRYVTRYLGLLRD